METATLKGIKVRSVPSSETSQVVWLREPNATSSTKVGAKAANLARLRQAGFPVPSGIVVTTTAFARYLETISLSSVDSRDLQRAILSSPLESSLQSELRNALRELGDLPVAVRSSGVAEDLEGASFAGQYDTLLGVRGFDAIEKAVRKCFVSAFNEQILQYLNSKQILRGRMAVLIQPLINADVAGVAFTANPVNGDRTETVVSGVRGLGERLVSGEATPDEWIVRGGTATAKSTPESSLNSRQVLEIAQLARRVESHYGVPQDIEWAIHQGQLHLLQARPITTLAAEVHTEMIPVSVDPPEGFWEREESHYPDPLMPITSTAFVPIVNRAFLEVCDEMSLFIEALEVREIGGYIYQRVVPLGGRDRKAPPAWLMPLLIRVVPQLKTRIAGSVRAIREDLAGQWLDKWHTEWKPTLMNRAEQLRSQKLHDLSDDALLKYLRDAYSFLSQSIGWHLKINVSVQMILAEYAFVCRELLGWDESRMMLIFSGLSEMSSAPARALAELAHDVREELQLAKDVVDGVPISKLQHRYPKFSKQFDGYLRKFGCRAIRYELAFPSVRETPETSLRLLSDQLQRSYSPDDDASFLQQQRRMELALAEEILEGKTTADKARFQKALSRAEKAYPLREEHGFYDRDVPLALFRYALLEIGHRLHVQGALDKVDDVFFLEYDQVISSLGNSSAIRETVRISQGERNFVLGHPGPASYGKQPSAPPSMASFPEEARFSGAAVLWSIEKTFEAQKSGRVQTSVNRIQGIAASAGTYTGTVRIVHSESEFAKIQPGDVLVCPITSPVWSMVFPSIGALVTDSGGILSHSAIIAREYRIPAVVATGNVTKLLKDGQVVTVNGAEGIVELVS